MHHLRGAFLLAPWEVRVLNHPVWLPNSEINISLGSKLDKIAWKIINVFQKNN